MKKMILMAAVAALMSGCIDTGSGEKVGVVTKVAQQGVFCKTYEAQIVRGGLTGGTGVNGGTFEFTIENEEMAKKLNDAMEAQKEVKIKYRSEGATFCRSDSMNHFLTSFEVIEQKTPTVTITNSKESTSSEDDIQHLLQVQAELINKLATKK